MKFRDYLTEKAIMASGMPEIRRRLRKAFVQYPDYPATGFTDRLDKDFADMDIVFAISKETPDEVVAYTYLDDMSIGVEIGSRALY